MERQLKEICEGERTFREVIDKNLEKYKEIFVLVKRSSQQLAEVSTDNTPINLQRIKRQGLGLI